jgi:hypothetical protein
VTLAHFGLVDKALAAATSIRDLSNHAEVETALVRAQAGAGRLVEALRTAQSSASLPERIESLGIVAAARTKAGDAGEADMLLAEAESMGAQATTPRRLSTSAGRPASRWLTRTCRDGTVC